VYEGCSRVMEGRVKRMEGGKRNHLSYTSSPGEMPKIHISQKTDSHNLWGDNRWLHMGMAASFRRCQEPQTSEHADQSFIHWADPKTYSATCSCFDLCN
jgi:hypothetical protein